MKNARYIASLPKSVRKLTGPARRIDCVRRIALVALCGCGRIDFDPLSGSDGSPGTNLALEVGAPAGVYALIGNPALLHLSAYTIEMWISRTGPGTSSDTGQPGAGINPIIPLLAKGKGESESPTVDINYFVGLVPDAGYVAAADFEEGPTGPGPSNNHPIMGTTPVNMDGWHHVAITLDGLDWRLYLDTNLEAEKTFGQLTPPAATSDVNAVLGSSMRSTGLLVGSFDGYIDEVRIWDHALTQTDISDGFHRVVTSAPGLVARWGCDEGAGTTLHDSTPNALDASLAPAGAAVTWVAGAPIGP
jgi:hypothetical protein